MSLTLILQMLPEITIPQEMLTCFENCSRLQKFINSRNTDIFAIDDNFCVLPNCESPTQTATSVSPTPSPPSITPTRSPRVSIIPPIKIKTISKTPIFPDSTTESNRVTGLSNNCFVMITLYSRNCRSGIRRRCQKRSF